MPTVFGTRATIPKELANKHLRPSNTQIHKVDLNEEVSSTMSGYARARDLRMRAIQANIAKANIPAFRLVDALHSKSSKISRQEQVNLAIDSCSILASANSSINQLCRELVKPSLQKKHQVLCYKPPPSQTKFLFGDDLPERVKAANTVSSLLSSRSANRGRGGVNQNRYHPYQPYGYAGHHAYGQYGYGQYGYGQPQNWQ